LDGYKYNQLLKIDEVSSEEKDSEEE
jgi:hypothetical protein